MKAYISILKYKEANDDLISALENMGKGDL